MRNIICRSNTIFKKIITDIIPTKRISGFYRSRKGFYRLLLKNKIHILLLAHNLNRLILGQIDITYSHTYIVSIVTHQRFIELNIS